MKNFIYKSSLLFMLVLSMAIMTSCEDEGEGGGADAAAKLIGTWTMTDTEIEIKVGGIDIVQFLMAGLQLTEAQAMAMVEQFTQGMKDGFKGTITFKDDNTYNVVLTDDGPEAGTWRVSEDGKTLYTTPTGETEEDNMKIHTLTESMLIVKMNEEEYADLDGNEENGDETKLDMEITLTLTK